MYLNLFFQVLNFFVKVYRIRIQVLGWEIDVSQFKVVVEFIFKFS